MSASVCEGGAFLKISSLAVFFLVKLCFFICNVTPKETELLSTYDLVNQCIEDSFVLENVSSVARLEELHYRIISPNLRSDANIILQSITAKPKLKPKAVILRSSLRHVQSFLLELTTDIPKKFQKKGALKIMEHRVCKRIILLVKALHRINWAQPEQEQLDSVLSFMP